MFTYIKNIFRLLVTPARGWEEVSASGIPFDILLRKGFVPFVIFTALTEFVPLVYDHSATFLSSLGGSIAVGGGLFVSLFAARLFLDVVLPRYIDKDINMVKVNNLCIYLVGLDCFYRIFSNLLPASLTFLSFLPLLSILILFKSIPYLGVSEERALKYIFLSFVAVVVIPAVICRLLLLII